MVRGPDLGVGEPGQEAWDRGHKGADDGGLGRGGEAATGLRRSPAQHRVLHGRESCGSCAQRGQRHGAPRPLQAGVQRAGSLTDFTGCSHVRTLGPSGFPNARNGSTSGALRPGQRHVIPSLSGHLSGFSGAWPTGSEGRFAESPAWPPWELGFCGSHTGTDSSRRMELFPETLKLWGWWDRAGRRAALPPLTRDGTSQKPAASPTTLAGTLGKQQRGVWDRIPPHTRLLPLSLEMQGRAGWGEAQALFAVIVLRSLVCWDWVFLHGRLRAGAEERKGGGRF